VPAHQVQVLRRVRQIGECGAPGFRGHVRSLAATESPAAPDAAHAPAELGGREALRDRQLGDGLEERLARPGGAQALGRELADIDPAPRDDLGAPRTIPGRSWPMRWARPSPAARSPAPERRDRGLVRPRLRALRRAPLRAVARLAWPNRTRGRRPTSKRRVDGARRARVTGVVG
jgi:hypothetical protein